MSAFMEYLSGDLWGLGLPGFAGFAPAGIKGSDSDEVMLRKWEAYRDSSQFDHRLLPPKHVLRALIRQSDGDLAQLGLNIEQVAEFNDGFYPTPDGGWVLSHDDYEL
jgi:hypothetical protein